MILWPFFLKNFIISYLGTLKFNISTCEIFVSNFFAYTCLLVIFGLLRIYVSYSFCVCMHLYVSHVCFRRLPWASGLLLYTRTWSSFSVRIISKSALILYIYYLVLFLSELKLVCLWWNSQSTCFLFFFFFLKLYSCSSTIVHVSF